MVAWVGFCESAVALWLIQAAFLVCAWPQLHGQRHQDKAFLHRERRHPPHQPMSLPSICRTARALPRDRGPQQRRNGAAKWIR